MFVKKGSDEFKLLHIMISTKNYYYFEIILPDYKLHVYITPLLLLPKKFIFFFTPKLLKYLLDLIMYYIVVNSVVCYS